MLILSDPGAFRAEDTSLVFKFYACLTWLLDMPCFVSFLYHLATEAIMSLAKDQGVRTPMQVWSTVSLVETRTLLMSLTYFTFDQADSSVVVVFKACISGVLLLTMG